MDPAHALNEHERVEARERIQLAIAIVDSNPSSLLEGAPDNNHRVLERRLEILPHGLPRLNPDGVLLGPRHEWLGRSGLLAGRGGDRNRGGDRDGAAAETHEEGI